MVLPTAQAVAIPASAQPNADHWVREQMFEEDVRAVLRMMRPHSRERLQGWKEYRTGGSHFRVTISWDDEYEIGAGDQALAVPNMIDVMETLLVGSIQGQDDLTAAEEFEQYRQVVRELYHRLEQRQSCYE
jgi:hypothetical protein